MVHPTILIASVRHTGTHYMKEVLPFADQIHVTANADPEKHKRLAAYDKIVIPQRDLTLVASTWHRWAYHNGPENMVRAFENLAKLDGFIFSIDEKPFDALEEYLGREVVRTTEVVRHPRETDDLPLLTPDEITLTPAYQRAVESM